MRSSACEALGSPSSSSSPSVTFGEGVTGRVAATRDPIVIEDVKLEDGAAGAAAEGPDASADEKLRRIHELLDPRIRPGLAGDGGGLEVISFDGDTLQISYHGACGSCPSASGGTLRYIEGMLQEEVDPNLRVISY